MIEMIKTKSIYDPKEEIDGIRILITRYWPRGVKKENGGIKNYLPQKIY